MKKLVCGFFVLLCCASALAGDRGPSTQQERERYLKAVKAIEQNPMSPDVVREREWALQFLIEVPDVHAQVCAQSIPALIVKEQTKNYAGALFVMMTLGSGAFYIEHPEKANDEQAIFVAGVESALRGYEGIVKANPKAKWDVLDQLVAKRDAGELAGFVASQCSGENRSQMKVEQK